MKKYLAVLFFCIPFFAYAQSREDIIIGIPTPIGGTTEQQSFFRENFVMETTAAGYTVAQESQQSDYTLNLEIKRNMILYDDGTEEEPPPEEKQYLLAIHLVRTDDKTEIVYFDFPFTELEEMYEFNLYLLYQAMANVPLTKLTNVVEYDHWRNKWLYVRGSFDYSVINYQVDTSQPNTEEDIWNKAGNQGGYTSGQRIAVPPEDQQVGRTSLGGTIGLELQFLNWMSVEGFAKFLFGDTGSASFVPTVGLQIKFPLKPAKHFMIEPYAMVEFPQNTGAGIQTFSLLGVGGGVQFGVKGGDMGAFFIDASFIYNLGDIHIIEPDKVNRNAHWNRWVLGFGIGYKIGFFNRNPEEANARVRAGNDSVPAEQPVPQPEQAVSAEAVESAPAE